MMAVVGVDAELVDDLEVVFAPVLDVDQGVGKRGAVVAGKVVSLAEDTGGGEDVGSDELINEARKFAIGETDAIEGLEFFAEVLLERGAVADVVTVGVLQANEFLYELVLKLAFGGRHCWPWNGCTASRAWNVAVSRAFSGSSHYRVICHAIDAENTRPVDYVVFRSSGPERKIRGPSASDGRVEQETSPPNRPRTHRSSSRTCRHRRYTIGKERLRGSRSCLETTGVVLKVTF